METIYLLQSAASPALDSFMLLITNLGHDMTYIALLVVAYLGFGPEQGRNLGLLFLGSMYLNGVMKDLFDTLRPYQIDPDVLRVQSAADSAAGAGFPSGHTQSATAFWGVAAWYVRRPWFTVLALVLIALIALSRVYLGVHLPIDIVVGFSLGLLTVLLVPLLDRSQLTLSRPLQLLLALVLPLAVHLLLPATNSGMLLGGLSGFLAGPLLYRHRLPGTVAGRVAVTLVGLALVFVVLLGSSALLSEELKRHPVGEYVRYLIIALTGVVVAPALVGLLRKRGSPDPAEGHLAHRHETAD